MNIKRRNKLQNNKWVNRPPLQNWVLGPTIMLKPMHGLDLKRELITILCQKNQNGIKANGTNGRFTSEEVREIADREKEPLNLVIETVSVTAKMRKLK